MIACVIPFMVQAQNLSAEKCTDKNVKEIKANAAAPSDGAMPAPADGKYPEAPKVKLPLLSKGNTAYAYKRYSTPGGYVSFDVAAPTNLTPLSAEPDIYGGDAYNGVLYAYTQYGNFLKINSATGAINETITGAWTEFMSDMAYDYSTNTMYGVKNLQLYTINLTTGVPTPTVALSGMTDRKSVV